MQHIIFKSEIKNVRNWDIAMLRILNPSHKLDRNKKIKNGPDNTEPIS